MKRPYCEELYLAPKLSRPDSESRSLAGVGSDHCTRGSLTRSHSVTSEIVAEICGRLSDLSYLSGRLDVTRSNTMTFCLLEQHRDHLSISRRRGKLALPVNFTRFELFQNICDRHSPPHMQVSTSRFIYKIHVFAHLIGM